MITADINRGWRVVAEALVELPLPHERVAAEMAHLRHFATHDLFHAELNAEAADEQGEPLPGSAITIDHRFFGLHIERRGKMLWRDPQRGFGFTDLSKRTPRRGFPHSCHYVLEPLGRETSSVRIIVRGTWTLRIVPRFIANVYLRSVLLLSALAMRGHILRLHSWRGNETTGPHQNPSERERSPQ